MDTPRPSAHANGGPMDTQHDLTLREMLLLSQQKLDALIATVTQLSVNVEQRLSAGDRQFGELNLWRQSVNSSIASLDQRVGEVQREQDRLRDARPIPRIEALEASVKPLVEERAAHQAQLRLLGFLFGTPGRALLTIGTAIAIAVLTRWLWP